MLLESGTVLLVEQKLKVNFQVPPKCLWTGGDGGKEPNCQCRRPKRWDRSLGWEDPLEEATHFSTLAFRIPWTEEPGGLQSKGGKELDTAEVT